MKEKTNWERKSSIAHLYSSEPGNRPMDNRWAKFGILAAAGMIISALAIGVMKSDYYGRPDEEAADGADEE